MAKRKRLSSDYLGPGAIVHIDGRRYTTLRPTELGWEMEACEPGHKPKKRVVTREELDVGEEDGSMRVERPRSERPEVMAMPLKHRRDIALKHSWMRRLTDGLRDGSVASTGDVALQKFVAANIDAVTMEIRQWDADAGITGKRKKTVGATGVSLEIAPSPRQMRRLLKRYVDAAHQPLALRKRTERMGAGGRRIDDRVDAIVREVAAEYVSEGNPTVAGLHRLVRARIVAVNYPKSSDGQIHEVPDARKLKAPSEGTLARRIEDIPDFHKILARKGAAGARRRYGPFGEGPQYHRVGEMVETDCWNIPLFVLLKDADVLSEVPEEIADPLLQYAKRIYVAVVVDKAPGYILGMQFGLTESSRLAIAAMRQAVTDKSTIPDWADAASPWYHTGIEEGRSDAGPAFYASTTQAVVYSAFSRLVYAASGLPHLRGLIESIFSTMHKGFIAGQVARAFENVVKRGDYEAQKRAVLLLEEFLKLLVRYVIDVYHNLPRYAGKRRSPRREFEAMAHGAKAPPNGDEIRVWFGTPARRKRGPRGVTLMHIEYDSDWFLMNRMDDGLETEVDIRFDEEDLGAISVLLDGQWITVQAKDRDFRGVSLNAWMSILEDVRLRVGAEAEMDFRQFVAPALLDFHKVNKAKPKQMGLLDVEWTKDRLESAEARYRIRRVHDTDPAEIDETPSVSNGLLGRRFDRPATPQLPAPSAAVKPETVNADPADTPEQPPATRKRMTFRED